MKPQKTTSSNGWAWVRSFKEAYDEARFGDAAKLYDANAGRSEPVEIVLQSARAHMHADSAAVIGLLVDFKIPSSMPREAFHRRALLAEAFSRSQDFHSADEHLESALKIARTLSDLDLVAIAGYRYVRRYLHAEDPKEARRFLHLTREGASLAARVFALYSEALILPYEERVREQADRLVELLRSLDPASTDFIDVRTSATEALALLARDIYIPDAIPEIERQLTGPPWTADFASSRFQTLKALGWAKALQGDYFNAFRHLKQASAAASGDAWKVVAKCDRAYLARSVGEARWARQELDDAEQLAAKVNWHSTLGEERAGLLLMAELFTSLDSAKSAMYLARYRELGSIKSPLFHRHDARLAAFVQFSTGAVEIALGNKKRGLTELRKALKTFERFGYDFRAARCLMIEFEATGNTDLLGTAREKLRNFGQSWLAADVRAAGAAGDVLDLPPMQKKVFEEVCRGKSTAEIAKILGRSEYTVSNHVKLIFKAFCVKSRPALIAEAIRRGLLRIS